MTKSWPSCDGKLLHGDIRKLQVPLANGFGGEDIIRAGNLRYEYQTGDKTYTGTRISRSFPTDSFLVHANAAWIVEKYYDWLFRRAPTITVFYHPAKPWVSVLLPGFRTYHFVRLFQIALSLSVAWIFIK